ncbi:MAG: demethoxyubiquinone hydroxylase family protein [Myxococcales bacterium]|nr:demethoxyubiquinone hydroxylase family protein [Myxococcales bacterium]
MTLSIERDLQNLCSFQRGELAAVATYEQALEAVQDPDSKRILLNCLRSHADRAKTLENRISQLGGTPAESAGPWGAMAKALEATARAMGAVPALAVLSEGEGHGLADYERDLPKLAPNNQELVGEMLIPEQRRTLKTIQNLRDTHQRH